MAKATLISLQIILAANALLAYSADEFIKVGSFNTSNDYYVSFNSAVWSDAEVACKLNFGSYASTVAIETLDEWNYLKTTLAPYGCGIAYWSNGVYDTTANAWKWAANNQTFVHFAWASGQPSPTPSATSRLFISYTKPTASSWVSDANIQKHRYICEVPRPVAVPCYNTNDLIVLLDSSGSIGSQNYETAKSFVDKLAAAFTVQSTSRFGFLIFSNDASIIVNLANTFSPTVMSSTILAATYVEGVTNTDLGINAAVAQFNSSIRQFPLNLVLLTDGASTNSALTIAAADRAISLGIRTFSVGIGTNINQEELLAIAGANQNRVYSTNTFPELIELLNPLSRLICTN